MINNNTLTNLSFIGFSNYEISKDGTLYKTAPNRIIIKCDSKHRLFLINDNGEQNRISLKEIYKIAFGEEYAIDNI